MHRQTSVKFALAVAAARVAASAATPACRTAHLDARFGRSAALVWAPPIVSVALDDASIARCTPHGSKRCCNLERANKS